MDILYGLLVAFHILVSVLLIIVVLLQPGRSGGGLGTAFGGGSATSVFGGRGATTFLSKATGVLAAIFFVLSVAIAMTGSERSVTEQVEAPAKQSEEVAPPPAQEQAPSQEAQQKQGGEGEGAGAGQTENSGSQ